MLRRNTYNEVMENFLNGALLVCLISANECEFMGEVGSMFQLAKNDGIYFQGIYV